jgi:hypothetical protein
MEIANIVCETKMDLGKEFNIVTSMDDIEHKEIPTLIIGFHIAKEKLGPELDMVERKEGNVHWTFKKNEKRDLYTQDLNNFIQYAYIKAVDDLTYFYVDPFSLSLNNTKRIIEKIKSLGNIISYLHNDRMLYIYGENIVFGIDLKVIKFIGLDKSKLVEKLRNLSDVFLEGDEILIEYKNYMERLDEQVKFIPFLYSISNDE